MTTHLTQAEVLELLTQKMKQDNVNNVVLAYRLGITPAFISKIRRGTVLPSGVVLEYLGLKREFTFRRISDVED